MNRAPCAQITRTATIVAGPDNYQSLDSSILDMEGNGVYYCFGPYAGLTDSTVDDSLVGVWEFLVTETD